MSIPLKLLLFILFAALNTSHFSITNILRAGPSAIYSLGVAQFLDKNPAFKMRPRVLIVKTDIVINDFYSKEVNDEVEDFKK